MKRKMIRGGKKMRYTLWKFRVFEEKTAILVIIPKEEKTVFEKKEISKEVTGMQTFWVEKDMKKE